MLAEKLLEIVIMEKLIIKSLITSVICFARRSPEFVVSLHLRNVCIRGSMYMPTDRISVAKGWKPINT